MIQPLFEGPVDVVGDVHGDWEGLGRLLQRLGYESDGAHAHGRRLVFVGDLVDRGPDSVTVCRFVRELMQRGRAQAILGNHELNLILGKRRPGNEWFYGEAQLYRDGRPLRQRLAGAAERRELLAFFRGLPLALEREDARVVHACWHPESVESVRAEDDVLAVHERRLREIRRSRPPQEPAGALERELALQNQNPVQVLTSGLERAADAAFEADGRSRLAERVRWWEQYEDAAVVVFGHYWRSRDPQRRLSRRPYLFDGSSPCGALGPRGTAWCIDYSNGHRLAESVERGGAETVAALAALRLPERELVLV
ncbi:MAG: metallophosphoesterase [Planctomycetota bacterium]|nr:MAG: metallophosphoesterase [Planctomycetota bacterium]